MYSQSSVSFKAIIFFNDKVHIIHRRRIELEDKAKVVASV